MVSVIVPMYNHAGYVVAALQSIFEQSHADIDLIAIDDASTDGTFEIAKQLCEQTAFSERFQRIIVEQNQENRGAHATLNTGFELAIGDYITCLNSDDLFQPNRLTVLLNAAYKFEEAPLFTPVTCIDANGNVDKNDPLAQHFRAIQRPLTTGHLPSLGFALLRHQVAISTGNMWFHRNIVRKIGGFRNLRYVHDWDYMMRAICHAEPVFVTGTSYLYRLHGSNSFRDLGPVAISETATVLGNYFEAIMARRVTNSIAPTPYNWPGVFEMHVEEFELTTLWSEIGHRPAYARRQR